MKSDISYITLITFDLFRSKKIEISREIKHTSIDIIRSNYGQVPQTGLLTSVNGDPTEKLAGSTIKFVTHQEVIF